MARNEHTEIIIYQNNRADSTVESCNSSTTNNIYGSTLDKVFEFTESIMCYQEPFSISNHRSGLPDILSCPEIQRPHTLLDSHLLCPVTNLDPEPSSVRNHMNSHNPVEYHTSIITTPVTHVITAFNVAKSADTTVYPPNCTDVHTSYDVTCKNSNESCAAYGQSEYNGESSVNDNLNQGHANQCSLSISHPQPVHCGFNRQESLDCRASLHDGMEYEVTCGDATEVMRNSWSIYDEFLPEVDFYDAFDEWPDGDLKRIYAVNNAQVMRHKSGWSMDDCNNHNAMVLKKSCLGTLKCSENCNPPGGPVSYRPAILKSSRLKQLCKFTCTYLKHSQPFGQPIN